MSQPTDQLGSPGSQRRPRKCAPDRRGAASVLALPRRFLQAPDSQGRASGGSFRSPDPIENVRVSNLRVARQEQHLGEHLGAPGIVVRKWEEKPPAIL